MASKDTCLSQPGDFPYNFSFLGLYSLQSIILIVKSIIFSINSYPSLLIDSIFSSSHFVNLILRLGFHECRFWTQLSYHKSTDLGFRDSHSTAKVMHAFFFCSSNLDVYLFQLCLYHGGFLCRDNRNVKALVCGNLWKDENKRQSRCFNRTLEKSTKLILDWVKETKNYNGRISSIVQSLLPIPTLLIPISPPVAATSSASLAFFPFTTCTTSPLVFLFSLLPKISVMGIWQD